MSESKNLGFGGPDGPRRGDGGTFKFTPFAPASQKEDSNQITREFYDSLLVEYRFLGSAVPTTETEIFGERFSTPIMIGGMLIGMLIWRVILGLVARRVSKNRGRKGGFWWGFFLGMIGIIVEAVRPKE